MKRSSRTSPDRSFALQIAVSESHDAYATQDSALRRANRQTEKCEACSVSGVKHRSKALPPGKTLTRNRQKLQARLDALAATMHQLKLVDARQPSLREAFDLFTDFPMNIYVEEADRAWWCEQVCAAAERYGLAEDLWSDSPERP